MKPIKTILCLLLAAALMLSVLAGCGGGTKDDGGVSSMGEKTDAALREPKYPDANPDGTADKPELNAEFVRSLIKFCGDSSAEVAAGVDTAENMAFSPVSLYMALAMTSAGAENATRDQMMKAFRMDSMDKETLADQTQKLFQNLYFDTDAGKTYLANSIWVDDSLPVKEEFYKTTADKFFAPAYNVDLQDRAAQERISDWVKEKTNGKVTRKEPEDTKDLVMSLINAIYFIDQWSSQFDPKQTRDDTFTCAEGKEVTVPFMHQLLESAYYFKDDKTYEEVALPFRNGYSMKFYLPVQGVSANDLLSKNLIKRGEEVPYVYTWSKVNLSLPKFDIKADMDLKAVCEKLGLSDAFDSQKADFSGISKKPVFISDVNQSAAVTVDENGCEAAAYTEVGLRASGLMDEITVVEFNLNRPFAYEILDANDIPLFSGVVNNPAK